MKKTGFLIGLVALIIFIGVWVVGGYNGLVTAREKVAESFAQVETQYQRRFDLIPNLVSTVKGAAGFEQETFTAVTAARSAWASAGQGTGAVDTSVRAERVAAAQQLDSALSRLLVTVENYPQLQATQAFRDLMTQLEGTENRIGTARRDYNEVVRDYNLRVRRFPGNLLAGLFGFAPEAFFEAASGTELAPTVDFGQ